MEASKPWQLSQAGSVLVMHPKDGSHPWSHAHPMEIRKSTSISSQLPFSHQRQQRQRHERLPTAHTKQHCAVGANIASIVRLRWLLHRWPHRPSHSSGTKGGLRSSAHPRCKASCSAAGEVTRGTVAALQIAQPCLLLASAAQQDWNECRCK